MPPTALPFKVILRDFHASAAFKEDGWGRENVEQPLVITVELLLFKPTSDSASAQQDIGGTFTNDGKYVPDDSLAQSYSYSTLRKTVAGVLSGGPFPSLSSLTDKIYAAGFVEWPAEEIHVRVSAPKLILRLDSNVRSGSSSGSLDFYCSPPKFSVGGSIPLPSGGGGGVSHCMFARRPALAASQERRATSFMTAHPVVDRDEFITLGTIRAGCIIGLNEHERSMKQDVLVDIGLRGIGDIQQKVWPEGYIPHEWLRRGAQGVHELIEQSSFQTVEALAKSIAVQLSSGPGQWDVVTVRIEKPSAMPFVDGAGVELTVFAGWMKD